MLLSKSADIATFQCLHNIVLHVLTTAASQDLQCCLTILDVDDGEVAGGLHNVGIAGDHTYHTIVTGVDRVDQVVLDFLRNLCLRSLYAARRNSFRFDIEHGQLLHRDGQVLSVVDVVGRFRQVVIFVQ